MLPNPSGSGDGSTFGFGFMDTSSNAVFGIQLPTTMRTTPSLSVTSTANGLEIGYYNATATAHNPTSLVFYSQLSSQNIATLTLGTGSFSNGTGCFVRYADKVITPCVFFSAEL